MTTPQLPRHAQDDREEFEMWATLILGLAVGAILGGIGAAAAIWWLG
jgi:hypothetical protein